MSIGKTIVISIRLGISIYIQLKKHQLSTDFFFHLNTAEFPLIIWEFSISLLHHHHHHHHRFLHSQSPDGGIHKKESDWSIQSQIFLRLFGWLSCMPIHKYWPVLDMWLIPQIHISAAGTCINTDFCCFRLFTFLVFLY